MPQSAWSQHLIFKFIYSELYEEDCAILWICWAIAPPMSQVISRAHSWPTLITVKHAYVGDRPLMTSWDAHKDVPGKSDHLPFTFDLIFPTICDLLALDSWNYCCGEQGMTAQHLQDYLIFFIQPNHVYKIKINKIRLCHHMITPLYHKVACFLFFNEAT